MKQKRCPTCGRKYVDETLNFCLEDGAPLVFGESAAEPSTAILPAAALTGESPTVTFGSGSASHADAVVSPSPSGRTPNSKRRFLIAGILGVILIAILGSYIYYARRPSAQIESIAVMPFVNESGSGEIDYLSDGMTETLINSLSQLPKLSVKGRSSVFRYKGKEVDSKQIASELNVQAILNGRVLQRGDALILSLDLVDAITGNQIWGEQYNRKVSDLVSLQNEIARDVSGKLQKKLSGADERNLAKNYNVNPEAYQLYLQGRFQWNKRTDEGTAKATELFQQAIDKDPGYALAYVGLADSLIVGYDRPVDGVNPKIKARAMALKALELDPALGEAHAVLGNVAMYYDWDWATSEREYKRAIELSPNYATAYHWYGEGLAAVGRFDDSFAEYRRAMELDPLSLAISTDLGWAYFHSRQFDRGIEHLKKLIELDPTYVRTRFYLASAYEEKHMFEAAIEERQKGLILSGANIERVADSMKRLSNAFSTAGPKGYWQTSLDLTQEAAKRKGERVNPTEMAVIYAKLDDKDHAFEWLEKAFQERGTELIFLKVEPAWDALRSDPRFSISPAEQAYPNNVRLSEGGKYMAVN